MDIVVIAVAASYVVVTVRPPSIAGPTSAGWLENFLSLPNGSFTRCFVAVDGAEARGVPGAPGWLAHVTKTDIAARTADAIDGKRVGGPMTPQRLGAPHHHWASEEGSPWARSPQRRSNDHGVPELLKQIELKDSLITIDAMVAKRDRADIVDGGGDFGSTSRTTNPSFEKRSKHTQ